MISSTTLFTKTLRLKQVVLSGTILRGVVVGENDCENIHSVTNTHPPLESANWSRDQDQFFSTLSRPLFFYQKWDYNLLLFLFGLNCKSLKIGHFDQQFRWNFLTESQCQVQWSESFGILYDLLNIRRTTYINLVR